MTLDEITHVEMAGTRKMTYDEITRCRALLMAALGVRG